MALMRLGYVDTAVSEKFCHWFVLRVVEQEHSVYAGLTVSACLVTVVLLVLGVLVISAHIFGVIKVRKSQK